MQVAKGELIKPFWNSWYGICRYSYTGNEAMTDFILPCITFHFWKVTPKKTCWNFPVGKEKGNGRRNKLLVATLHLLSVKGSSEGLKCYSSSMWKLLYGTSRSYAWGLQQLMKEHFIVLRLLSFPDMEKVWASQACTCEFGMASPENCLNGFFLLYRINKYLNCCLCIAKPNQQQRSEAANGCRFPCEWQSLAFLGSGRYLCDGVVNLQKPFVLIYLGASFVKASAAALQILCQSS